MRKSILIITAVFLSAVAYGQDNRWAVGAKLGEPTAVSIRKYFNNVQAIDVTLGTYGGIMSRHRQYRGDNGSYKNTGVSLQVHYLWHTPVFDSETLQVYYGIGTQINNRKAYPRRLNGEYEKNLSLGGSVLGGLEYALVGSRMSIFLEGGTYVELLKKPLFLSPNLSAGVRLQLSGD